MFGLLRPRTPTSIEIQSYWRSLVLLTRRRVEFHLRLGPHEVPPFVILTVIASFVSYDLITHLGFGINPLQFP